MEQEQIYNLLAKHFSGETTSEEKKIINSWLQEDPLNKDLYNEIKNIWAKTHFETDSWDVNGAWKNVTVKAEIQNETFANSSMPKRTAAISFYYARFAAVFLIVIGGYFLLNKVGIFHQDKNNSMWIEKITVPGEKMELTLSDNSKIILNASSKIKYPKHFNNNTREIYLEGEAYFEVAHNPSEPFIVHSGKISTTVLGTKFNVSAFAGDKNILVTLIEGEVKVSKEESNEVQPIIMLRPNQQLVYNQEARVSTVGQFDVEKTIGWKDGILKFDDESLTEVFKRLERSYGTKFELANKSFNDFKVTANFKKESCRTVTEVIEKLTGLNAKMISENNEVKKIIFEEK